jgi:hypothetical protein
MVLPLVFGQVAIGFAFELAAGCLLSTMTMRKRINCIVCTSVLLAVLLTASCSPLGPAAIQTVVLHSASDTREDHA